MKAYVRAPYSEDCLQELRQMFDEVVYEPWTATGERYYEDEMLENLRRVQPDVLITELDRVTEKVLSGYDGLRVIGDCRGPRRIWMWRPAPATACPSSAPPAATPRRWPRWWWG